MYYVYMLLCSDNTLYTGSTNQLQKRLEVHNAGKGAKYTRSRLPVKLVYWEMCCDRSQALRREWAIKQLTRKEKISLVLSFSQFEQESNYKVNFENPRKK